MHRDFSEDMAKKIDTEVKRIIDTAYKKAFAIITKHKDKLIELSEILLEKESFDGRVLNKTLGLESDTPEMDKLIQQPRRSRSRSSHSRRRPENSNKKEATNKPVKSPEASEKPPQDPVKE